MKRKVGIFIVAFLALSLLMTQVSFSESDAESARDRWRRILERFRKPDVEGPKETEPQGTQPEADVDIETRTEREPAAGTAKSNLEGLSEEEIRSRIRGMLEETPEIAEAIPELKLTTDKDGNVVKIEYRAGGVFLSLEELNRNTLVLVHNRVKNESLRLQAERIHKQLQAVKAAREAAKSGTAVPGTPKVPVPPPSLPKIPTVPSTPDIPKVPSQSQSTPQETPAED